MSVLAVRSLSKAFGGVHAVNEVSFDVAPAEFLAMIGPNGAGKSSCFKMINGQITPESGGGVEEEVKGWSFETAPAESPAMIGPNGAGKSTCFNMINGHLTPDSGEVLLAGRNIAGLAPRAIWRLGVGRTFQVAATFASMTVVENVQMALISHAGETHRLWRAAARHPPPPAPP